MSNNAAWLAVIMKFSVVLHTDDGVRALWRHRTRIAGLLFRRRYAG
ncbi:hypothetical protein [Acidithiobacillus ferrooxidans]|nr:hypothetical protein [Acidithiobacillus ferrooxidans]